MESRPICLCDRCFTGTGLQESLTMGLSGNERCAYCGTTINEGVGYNWIWDKKEKKQKKFLKIPAVVRVITETDEEGTIVDGWSLINVSEVQDVISDDTGKSTIYFKSGDSLGTSLSLDELAMILE